MKVLFVLSRFPKLSETFILNQITGLIDSGIDIQILARLDSKETVIHDDVEKYELLEKHTNYYDEYNSTSELLFRTIKKFITVNQLKYIKFLRTPENRNLKNINFINSYLNLKNNFDIIHVHFGYNGYPSLKLKENNIFKGKFITSFYGNDLGSFIINNDNSYQKLIKHGDYFLPVSNFLSKKLISLKFPEDKIKIHRIGIDINKFKFHTKQKNTKIKLLSVGRFVEKKGFNISIRAISKIINTFNFKNIEYNIIGSGKLANELQIISEKENIMNYINFLGNKTNEEVRNYMYNSDIFILPSITAKNGDIEGTPTVIMEAMSSGLPVVSTYHSGIPELINNETTGLLCKEKDYDELAEKIFHLIKNFEKRCILAVNARKFVQNYHNINSLNNELIKFYTSILNK